MRKILIFSAFAVCFFFMGCSKKKNEPAPIDKREKYVGTYSVSENCSGHTDSYTITIEKGTDSDKVLIKNFANLFNVVATVDFSKSGELYIGSIQPVIGKDRYKYDLFSSGDNSTTSNKENVLDNGIIYFTFTITNTNYYQSQGTSIYYVDCTASATKQ